MVHSTIMAVNQHDVRELVPQDVFEDKVEAPEALEPEEAEQLRENFALFPTYLPAEVRERIGEQDGPSDRLYHFIPFRLAKNSNWIAVGVYVEEPGSGKLTRIAGTVSIPGRYVRRALADE